MREAGTQASQNAKKVGLKEKSKINFTEVHQESDEPPCPDHLKSIKNFGDFRYHYKIGKKLADACHGEVR